MSAPDGRELLTDPPQLRFDDRVVWITGASRGLGRTLAYAFAGAGASVVLTARSEAALEDIVHDITSAGGAAIAHAGSVTDIKAVKAVVEEIRGTWGTLDVLVNNAGISSRFLPAESQSVEDLREVLDVNLLGAFSHCCEALPLLESNGRGAIVNVSSVHGTVASERTVGYAASKGALEMMTRTMAVEWAARNVRVNSLAPAYIATDMTSDLLDHPKWGAELLSQTPLGRFATTSEIAACAMFLASPLASYVTGTTLYADGGWTAR